MKIRAGNVINSLIAPFTRMLDYMSRLEGGTRERRVKYFLIGLFIHLGMLAILAPIYIVSPFTSEVLLKGKLKEREKTTAPAVSKPAKIEKRVVTEVPVHLLKKKPEVKKVHVGKEAKMPTAIKVPETVVPKTAKVTRTHKISSDNIITKERARRDRTYKKFAKKFHVSGRGKAIKATFTPILARYARGDWNKDPKSLPNLMREVSRRSNVNANEKPKLVSVSSKEIFDCPFVYFTGTRDFVFTTQEVENLREYLLKGGLVGADNGLPGRRSRFDIAFRREMKRVLADRDFEPVPMGHPIFGSFYTFNEVPSAMNYRADPLEMIKIDKRMAVIYTLNDYGDLWETRFNAKGEPDGSLDEQWESNLGPHWGNWQFENLNEETIEAAYRLGINIVAYLLTR